MASTLVTPLLIAQPFGFGAANPAYINIPIPVPSQISLTVNAASFTDGFPPNTMTPEASGGLPFFGQDMNGILWMVSAYCANFAAGALPKYNATMSSTITGYPLGAVLNATGPASGTNNLWVNVVDGNTTNPDTGGAGWLPVAGTGASQVSITGGSVTLTALQAALPYIAIEGNMPGNVNVVFPANSGQSWIVANVTAGSGTVTCKTASGTGVVIPQTGTAAPTSIYCDSANIQNTGVSTAGLAPLASPAFTGTPTAPTASPATTNNTQIATTAFTQAAITAALSLYARLASPIFSGNPTAPTQALSDNSLKLATTAFVQGLAGNSAVVSVNGGINFSNGIQVRWGIVNQTVAGVQTHNFSTPFSTACFVVIPVVASSTGVEFFSYQSSNVNGWNQYSNNTTLINYIAIGH